MIVLRQPSSFPITLSYEGLSADTDYVLKIYDDTAVMLYSYDLTSDSGGTVSQQIDQSFEKYDGEYVVYVYSLDDEDEPEDTVVIDNLSIKRPYVNPLLLGDTPEQDDEAVYNERIARAIIDSITGGFYYTCDTVEITGLGGDYLPAPGRINRINHVYKNNMLVYNRFADESVTQDEYIISSDNAAITIKKEGLYNRTQSKPVDLPLAASDSFNLYNDSDDPIAALTKVKEFDLFAKDYDFIVVGEFGYPVVPLDIQEATKILINDIQCGKLNYVDKYITEYKTDQFTIKYDKMAWSGTGNRIVDEILQRYTNNFYKLGVL